MVGFQIPMVGSVAWLTTLEKSLSMRPNGILGKTGSLCLAMVGCRIDDRPKVDQDREGPRNKQETREIEGCGCQKEEGGR